MAALRHLPQQTRWFIAALLCVTLAFALVTQFAVSERAPDEAFGTTLLTPQADSDEAGNSPDANTAFAALPARILPLLPRLAYSLSTARHLTAAYLLSFIIAPSRAPPQPRRI
jgi:hypothetical protein